MVRNAARHHEFSENRKHVLAVQAPLSHDGKAFPCEFINHGKHAELSSITRSILDEVVCPNMVRPFWPQPDARTIIQPKPTPFRLPLRDPTIIVENCRVCAEAGAAVPQPVATAATAEEGEDEDDGALRPIIKVMPRYPRNALMNKDIVQVVYFIPPAQYRQLQVINKLYGIGKAIR